MGYLLASKFSCIDHTADKASLNGKLVLVNLRIWRLWWNICTNNTSQKIGLLSHNIQSIAKFQSIMPKISWKRGYKGLHFPQVIWLNEVWGQSWSMVGEAHFSLSFYCTLNIVAATYSLYIHHLAVSPLSPSHQLSLTHSWYRAQTWFP